MTRRDLLKRGALLGAATMANSLVIIEKAPAAPSGFIPGSDAPGAAAAIDALYGGPESGSWLTTKLPDNSAVAPTSADAVNYIANINPNARWLNGVVNGNFTSIVNVVPADQPLVEVVPRGNATANYAGALQAVFANGVPIPEDIPPFPAGDTDAELVIIQPDWVDPVYGIKGRMWELWVAQHPSTTQSGKWEASWGGRAPGTNGWLSGHWFDWWWSEAGPPNDWTTDGIAWSHDMGAQATSIPLVGNLITRLDIIRGVIRHPLSLLLPLVPNDADKAGPVWPAQRFDGGSHRLCRQGYRFRFPAGYAIDPSWPWLTQRLVEALRDYGMVFTDTAGPLTGPTFRMEPGAADLVPGGVNIGAVMNAIPWADLEQIAIGSDAQYTPTS